MQDKLAILAKPIHPDGEKYQKLTELMAKHGMKLLGSGYFGSVFQSKK